MLKQLLFIASILCLIACSNNRKQFENISDAKQFAENNGYKVLFESDSTLTYLSSDTLYLYELKYDQTHIFPEDAIIYGDCELNLMKLYPMEMVFEPFDKRILNDENLFEILSQNTFLISSDQVKIFKLTNYDDMLGDVDVLYKFNIDYNSETEEYEPTLTRLEYDCNYEVNENGLSFKKTTYQPQYPYGFKDALSDIFTGESLREKFNEGGALITDIVIDKNGNIVSITPSNIMLGYNLDINIPIYDYDGDLLKAIECSL